MEPEGRRSTLRTYLGIAPGVGKTYTMLRDARAAARAGTDVVVGYLERHGRAGTSAQARNLELLAPRQFSYRGKSFEDLDVDAVLTRNPQLVLVDELARGKVGTHRREKRWQDVDVLLGAGMDVSTTLNLGNLESLRSLVARITGSRPAEPVPDAFVRAGEVKLVDLPPAALRRRLAQGLVVPADGVGTALSHYFRFANLAALRELAQLWMDESVPDAASAYAGLHGTGERDTGRVVVGLDGSSKDGWLIRYGANVAGLGGDSLSGVYVKPADGRVHPTTQLQADRRLLDDLGGTFAEVTADNPATGLVRAARRAGATQLVIGSPAGAWLSRIVHGSMARRVLRAAGDDLPVQLVCVGDKPPSSIA